jgi:hypothetical protein
MMKHIKRAQKKENERKEKRKQREEEKIVLVQKKPVFGILLEWSAHHLKLESCSPLQSTLDYLPMYKKNLSMMNRSRLHKKCLHKNFIFQHCFSLALKLETNGNE